MNSIIAVFTQNILPIFLVAGCGYAIQRWIGVDKKTLSRVVFFCFSPCLVFSSLVNSQIERTEVAGLVAFSVGVMGLMGVLTYLLTRVLRMGRQETAVLLITTMFANAGNYGLTLNQLRYGDAGLARAVIYYITSTILVYTVGVFIASMGRLDMRQTLQKLLRIPAIYAVSLAVIVYTLDLALPAPVVRAVEIAGNGAIPVMLLLLGMQLADLKGKAVWRLVAPAVGARLLLGPLVAVGMATLVGLSGLARSAGIIEASMPTAVFTIILATEFDLYPSAVTSIVVLSTLCSPLTLALAINLLGL